MRSFIHIRDVVEGTLIAMRKAPFGEIYHFSTSESISIRTLVQIIADKLNISFEEQVDVAGERLGKDTAYLLDNTKASQELGWKARIGLEEGIEDTIKWVKANLDRLKDMPFDYIHKP